MFSLAECVPWLAVTLMLSLAIIILNLITIIVFIKNRNLRKRSTYLMINLAVIDMLAGVAATDYFYFYVGVYSCNLWKDFLPDKLYVYVPRAILDILFLVASRNKMTPLGLLPWQQFCRWWCVNKNRNSQFCLKTKTIYPTQSYDGSEDNMGTMSVQSRTLQRLKMGIFSFLTERDWSRNSCYGNSIKCVILFLLWCTLLGTTFCARLTTLLRHVGCCWPFLNSSQQHPICCNIAQHGDQTHATCCAQQCCNMLRAFGGA